MSYYTMSRDGFADMLSAGRKNIDYVNPEDKHFWKHTFVIGLNTGVYWYSMFLVHADNFQDAVDEIADYCEKKGYAFFADDEELTDLRRDALLAGYEEDDFVNERYTVAGNNCRYLCNAELCYELVDKKRRVS